MSCASACKSDRYHRFERRTRLSTAREKAAPPPPASRSRAPATTTSAERTPIAPGKMADSELTDIMMDVDDDIEENNPEVSNEDYISQLISGSHNAYDYYGESYAETDLGDESVDVLNSGESQSSAVNMNEVTEDEGKENVQDSTHGDDQRGALAPRDHSPARRAPSPSPGVAYTDPTPEAEHHHYPQRPPPEGKQRPPAPSAAARARCRQDTAAARGAYPCRLMSSEIPRNRLSQPRRSKPSRAAADPHKPTPPTRTFASLPLHPAQAPCPEVASASRAAESRQGRRKAPRRLR
ncbi:hypothetical protein ZWY2020_059886 [Hordeum vulgare]|nr:hypothetical protein ZWY2020_059886 [Hordeum vulgare]